MTLAILSVAYGSTLLIVVGLRVMEHDIGVSRSTLALAGAMTWIGTGLGGIVMGWVSDRIGIRASVLIGTVMIALGLAISSIGSIWALYIGQGLLIGFFGMGAVYPPLLIYVSRWFDRRRGTAIALISSGQYIAGVIWPAVFERLIARIGWRTTYLGFAGVLLLGVIPLAALFLRPAPATAGRHPGKPETATLPQHACSGSGRIPFRPSFALPAFAAVCPWQSRRRIWLHSVATLGWVQRRARRCCRFCWAPPLFRGSSGCFRRPPRRSENRACRLRLSGRGNRRVSFDAERNGLFAVAAGYGFGFSGIIPAYSYRSATSSPPRKHPGEFRSCFSPP